jgi:hypothetical protein
VLTLVMPPALLSSCSSVNCESDALSGGFTGRVTSVRADVAQFSVESVSEVQTTSTPQVGQSVSVRYSDHEARFLHVGSTYRVVLAGSGAELVSTLSHACSTGTTWPDGSEIRAGSWWKRNHGLVLALSAPVVALLLFGVFELRDRRGYSWLRREV